ncbi:hypothetical protein F4804DRAFT_344261 [Jackrogersella minutella]|nr:hypothetical protein F4804DRAFT_344261 [Jackrogersella minutella]
MANNLLGLDDFHTDDLRNELPWPLFEMDLVENGDNTLAGDLTSYQVSIPSTTIGTVTEDTLDRGGAFGSNTEWRRADGNAPLDMNDPTVLNDYASLLLFANNPSAHHLDLGNCDSSKQVIIQALAAKLDLQYSYDASIGAIRLQKETYGEDLRQHEQQLKTDQRAIIPPEHQIPSPSSRWKPGYITEEQHDNFHNVNVPSPLFYSGAAMDIDTASRELNLENHDSWGADYSLTTPQNQSLLEDEEHLGQVSSGLVTSQPLRNSWVGLSLSRTLKELGACWRCKILRKKCSLDQPCKACPKPGKNNSRWQTIGCKRGTLLDHNTARISLCPKANTPDGIDVNASFDTARPTPKSSEYYRAELCLCDASDRLDAIYASENDTYVKIVLEILCSSMAITTEMSLSLRHDVEGNVIHIAWGLIDVASMKDTLRIKSVEHTLDVMKAAVTYENEYGLSKAVPIAIECFRNCIDILRLHDRGHLMAQLHDNCAPSNCQVKTFQNLSSNVKSFTDELSKVIFRKENRLHEKRWWLSVFYSLWIQSHVRRTLRFMESRPNITLRPETKEACSTYLLLALELFDAASASFDPLMSAWSLEEEPPNMDLRLMKYYRLAQKALLSEQWVCETSSSIDFLKRLYYDKDTPSATHLMEEFSMSSVASCVNDDSEDYGLFNETPSIVQLPKRAQTERKFSVPLRTRSGAKRRAGSPLQDMTYLRRNGSSSSMLDGRDMRSRGLSIASPGSPMSPAYSFAYDTSSSTRWNGSADSLAEMVKLPGTSPPNPKDQFDYRNLSRGHRSSLQYKSSNESFLELPRTLNKRRPRNNTNADTLRGFFLCECCPKKPKKFETMEELSAHEAERQYECSFCNTRFKSKNEAERHQNSLHVRRYVWSCSSILSSQFQESINQPGVADTCGYCGEDFPRSGEGFVRYVTDQDWKERLGHVQEAHKFGECNLAKKFYRADHFRQHLKHSHAATFGRWTNGLESICMMDIPPSRSMGDGT